MRQVSEKESNLTDRSPPKVTVMIPTYNHAKFIQQAITSALIQTYPNLEVLVGDDASTDQTSDIVKKINSSNLRYVRNPQNLGRTENYRKLLYAHATGEFVINLDGDDYYTDNTFISEAMSRIKDNPRTVLVAASARKLGLGFDHAAKMPNAMNLNGMKILESLPNAKYFFMHMAVLYSRKAALELDFYRSRTISSDWESLYRLALRGNVEYLQSTIGVWRIHGTNESKSVDATKHFENLSIWSAIYKDAIAAGMNSTLAMLRRERCIGYFAQSSFTVISKSGNSPLLDFVVKFAFEHPFAFLIVLLKPSYFARTILSFVGYYRRRGTQRKQQTNSTS